MDVGVAFLTFAVIISIPFGYATYSRHLRHKETLSMIEKGLVKPPSVQNGKDSLRWGIVLTAIGIALCIGIYPFGYLMKDSVFPLNFGPWMLIGLLPTFFGLALVTVYYALREENNKDNNNGD
jgi:NADH:ubiquinone oxidoreductase subunit 5 (subunit L)/multisubunit Na+/H+ antiporter MnhA subunit